MDSPTGSPQGLELHTEVVPHDQPERLASVFSVRDLAVYYGEFRAVRDVNVEIYEHEITAFIGPSGCGKTTVLRCFNRMNDLIEIA
ncbi:MAG: ATP-binding cassette domain-containing protein, partial [Microthrixaceae bacterium]|nr:ATP-binding cassette domain-containing protein [Microthrixaceae bacterium]